MPSMMGVRNAPLPVADVPCTPWKNSGVNRMVPYSPKQVRNVTATAAATTRLR